MMSSNHELELNTVLRSSKFDLQHDELDAATSSAVRQQRLCGGLDEPTYWQQRRGAPVDHLPRPFMPPPAQTPAHGILPSAFYDPRPPNTVHEAHLPWTLRHSSPVLVPQTCAGSDSTQRAADVPRYPLWRAGTPGSDWDPANICGLSNDAYFLSGYNGLWLATTSDASGGYVRSAFTAFQGFERPSVEDSSQMSCRSTSSQHVRYSDQPGCDCPNCHRDRFACWFRPGANTGKKLERSTSEGQLKMHGLTICNCICIVLHIQCNA